MLARKKILLIGSGAVIVLVLVVVFFIFQKKQGSSVSPVQGPGITQEKKPENLTTHKDEAGFSFNYPESFIVKDISGSDQTVYSSLEISSSNPEEKMVIKIIDTTFSSVDTWLKSKEASGAGSAREITLAGMPGKQIQFTDPRRLVTVVIDEGIMYFIQSPLASSAEASAKAEYWNKIHNDIISSFTLDQSQSPASQAGGEEVIYEEEEVIE